MAAGLHEFFLRIKSLFLRRRNDRELAEELEFHQALLRERLLRQGTPAAELDAAARRAFGNGSHWHERLRELWQFQSLENFSRDLSFSARLLRRSPGFTLVALLTLALGVGANTAVFSLINGLLLRPLPVPHAEQLVVLRMEEGGPEPNYSFCTPFFRSLEARHEVFADVFAYNPDTLQVQGRSGNENIHGMVVSGQFFRALRTPPLMGRYLTPEDDRKGGDPAGLAVVVTEQFWETWFDRAPDVIGRKLIIANVPFTVVGVMPKRFIGADPTHNPQIYAPLSADPIIDAPRNHIEDGVHAWWITVDARLQPGVTLVQANAALSSVSNGILHQASDDAGFIADEEKGHFHFVAEPGSQGYSYARVLFRKPLVAMFSMCAGILLLACLNLASLLMARAAARERELATRLAIGATRRRLIQQLLAESLLIAILGTGLGLAVAPLVSGSLAALLVNGESGWQLDTSLDVRVFAFAALVALASALLIGLIPALQATGGNLNDHIKDGQHTRPSHTLRRILPRCLLASEVALALVLVIGAGLLATSLARLYQSGVGFDPRGLVNIAFSMDKQQLEGDALMRRYQRTGRGIEPAARGKERQLPVHRPAFPSRLEWAIRCAWRKRAADLFEQRGPELFLDNAYSALSGQGIQVERHQGLRHEDDPQPVGGEVVFPWPGCFGAAGHRCAGTHPVRSGCRGRRREVQGYACAGAGSRVCPHHAGPAAETVPSCRAAGRWAAGSRGFGCAFPGGAVSAHHPCSGIDDHG